MIAALSQAMTPAGAGALMTRWIVAALLTSLCCAVANAQQESWLCVTPSTWCEMDPYTAGLPCPCADEIGVAVTVDDEGYVDSSIVGDICYTSAGQCFIAPTGIGLDCDCEGFPGIVGIQ
jgi:hypothetical protein